MRCISIATGACFEKTTFTIFKTQQMKTELIMKSDVLDIIFENRNKAYGAYYLRKFYNNRLMKSLALMMAVVVVLSAFTFIPKMKKDVKAELVYVNDYELKKLEDKIPEPEKPKDPPVPPKQNLPSVQYNSKINIVPDNTVVKPLETITDSTVIANITKPGEGGEGPLVGEPKDGGDDPGKGKEPVTEPAINPAVPSASAEIMPEYPGGIDGLRKFLQRNLTNPRDLEENEVVSVKVRFVVGYDGKLKGFETVQDGGEEFNKEVIRVLKKMPDWVPGKTRGQNVSVYYTIPVKFVASN